MSIQPLQVKAKVKATKSTNDCFFEQLQKNKLEMKHNLVYSFDVSRMASLWSKTKHKLPTRLTSKPINVPCDMHQKSRNEIANGYLP